MTSALIQILPYLSIVVTFNLSEARLDLQNVGVMTIVSSSSGGGDGGKR